MREKWLFQPAEHKLKPSPEDVTCVFCNQKGVHEVVCESRLTDGGKPCWAVFYNHECVEKATGYYHDGKFHKEDMSMYLGFVLFYIKEK